MRSRISALVCLVILASWMPVEAQFPGKKALEYKKGDKVQVQWGGKLYDGEVVSVNPVGLYQVSFLLNGRPFKPTLPPKFVKPPTSGKPGSGGGKPGSTNPPGTAHEYQKGDKVQVEWGGKTYDAEIVAVRPGGFYQVSFDFNGIAFKPVVPSRLVKPPKGGKSATGDGKHGSNNQGSGYKKGDKVQVEWSGKTYDAEIVAVSPGGFYQVSLLFNGRPLKTVVPIRSIKSLTGSKPGSSGSTSPVGSGAPGATMTGPSVSLTIKPADWSKVREVTVDESATWKGRIEASPAAPRRFESKPILLRRSGLDSVSQNSQWFERVLFARDSATAFAVVYNRHPSQPRAFDLYRCDLTSGTAAAAMRVTAKVVPVAVDSRGQRMLTSPHVFAGADVQQLCRVNLWRIGAKSADPLRSWNPDQSERAGTPAPVFLEFAGSKGVLTTLFTGETTFWNPESAQAIYTVKAFAGANPGLSPGGRHVALSVDRSVYVLDVESGRTIGKLPGTVSPNTTFSFRPDGTQLAAVSPQQVLIWDLKTGKLHRDIYLSQRLDASKFSVDWVDDGYVLVARQHLIDIERRIVLWKYTQERGIPLPETAGMFAGKLWYGLTSQDRTAMGIFQTSLPHAAARTAVATLTEDDILAVRPGTAVNIKINVSGTDQATVRAALTKQIRDLGLTISARARVLLEASTEPGESREVTYSGGATGGEKTVTATPQISRMKITESGKTLWEASRLKDVPFFLSLKEGQSIQQAVAAQQKPDLVFFSRVRVPQYVTRPHEKGAYGESVFTPKGIQ